MIWFDQFFFCVYNKSFLIKVVWFKFSQFSIDTDLESIKWIHQTEFECM